MILRLTAQTGDIKVYGAWTVCIICLFPRWHQGESQNSDWLLSFPEECRRILHPEVMKKQIKKTQTGITARSGVALQMFCCTWN